MIIIIRDKTTIKETIAKAPHSNFSIFQYGVSEKFSGLSKTVITQERGSLADAFGIIKENGFSTSVVKISDISYIKLHIFFTASYWFLKKLLIVSLIHAKNLLTHGKNQASSSLTPHAVGQSSSHGFISEGIDSGFVIVYAKKLGCIS